MHYIRLPGRCSRNNEMPIEEPVSIVALEVWDTGVPTYVGVQRFLLGPEGVEQIQRHLSVVSFVVPLQQNL